MTQFLALRQVFEIFLDQQDHFANLLVALVCLLSKTSLARSEALDYCTDFSNSVSFLSP
jgi:hypothetical protein